MYFAYAESWLKSTTPAPLSRSLPLRQERFTRKECAGFFGGILPEASGFQSFLVMKAWGLRRETMHLGYVHGRNNWEPT